MPKTVRDRAISSEFLTHRVVQECPVQMSKCELPLKVLQIANFSQITHSPTFGRAFTR